MGGREDHAEGAAVAVEVVAAGGGAEHGGGGHRGRRGARRGQSWDGPMENWGLAAIYTLAVFFLR